MWTCSAILLAATLAAEPVDSEKAFRAYADVAVGGTWTTTVNGAAVEQSWRWIANNRFLELTSKGGVLPFVAIVGVDPKSKKFTWWFYNEDGGTGKDIMTQEADGVWLLEGKGLGPKGEIRYKGRVTRVNADTVNEEVLEFVLYGEKQKGGTVVWKRKK